MRRVVTLTLLFAVLLPAAARAQSGPVAAYSFDAGSGTTAADVSGFGNAGTLVNAAWSGDGRFGGALSFNGTSAYVQVPDAASLDLTAAMTLEAWVRPQTGGGYRTVVVKEQPLNLVYGLYSSDDAGRPETQIATSTIRLVAGPSPLAADTWTHLASTYDGATQRLYVNGAQVASVAATGAIQTSSSPLKIGGNAIWGEFFDGLIDEVRVYNRALTATEIQADMNAPVGPADTTPPSAPGTLTATGGAGEAALAWGVATDNTGVTRYSVHRSTTAGFTPTAANRIAQPTGLTYTDTGLTAGTYVYKVVAEDGAGNAGPASNAATATVTTPSGPPPGLVAAYSFDQGAGTGLPDLSGASNHGTISGATWTTGRFGGALEFNGVNQTVTVPDAASLDLTTGLTLEAWVNPTALGGGWRTVLMKERGGSISYDLYAHGGSGSKAPTAELSIAGDRTIQAPSALALNTWTHLAATYGGGKFTLYVNGTQAAQGNQTGSIAVGTGALRIGGNGIWGEYFAGRIDELRVYDRALSAAEVAADMTRAIGPADTVPPTAPLNLTATGTLTSAQLAWTAATDDVGVVRYEVHRSTSAGFTPTPATRIAQPTGTSYTDPVAAGIYVYKVLAADAAGNLGPASNEASAQVGDVQPPSAPGTLTAVGSLGRATLSWAAATDNVGVTRYSVHRSTAAGFTPSAANRIAQPTGTSYTDTTAAGLYHYRVAAEDGAGNTGPPSNQASATVTADTQAPTAPGGLTATAATSTINLSWSAATDDVGVTRYDLHRSTTAGFTPSAANRIAQPTGTSYADAALAPGTYYYRVTAEDGAGNVGPASAQANATATQPPQPTGLVAAYGFDEGTGTTTADGSGNANTGTLASTVWSTAGKFGTALSFSGSARVNVNNSASLNTLTTGMTMEAWVRPAALTGWNTVLFRERPGYYTHTLYASTDSGRPMVQAYTSADHELPGTAALPVGAWSHLAATYNGTTLALFVNGTQVASKAASGPLVTTTGALRIGGNTIWGEYFSGLIDEVRLYSRALSAAEIQLDMARSVTPDETPPTVTAKTPPAGAAGLNVGTPVTATFSEAMLASSIGPTAFTLTSASGTAVPATVSYDAESRTATLTPQEALEYGRTYTARVHGAADLAGNALTADVTWSFSTEASPPQILVVGAAANPFGAYTGEILRNEGLDAFTTVDVSLLGATLLENFDVVILGETALTTSQVSTLTSWVNAGGNLVALRPDKKLAPLLGLTDAGTTLANAYLRVDTASAPGTGIVASTIQFHGTADRYTLSGARAVASLYTNATTATTNPAVTHRTVGSVGGEAAAFTYDLARSTVYTRQGNPAWAGQERDGITAVRPNELFFGGSQADWLDTSKIAIPQADEQQRLLANLLTLMQRDTMPLPRFWYLPNRERAAVVMSGDDHSPSQSPGGTVQNFDRMKALSPAGCSVAQWECVRGTSYVYPDANLTNAQATAYQAEGFEVALHLNIGSCPATVPPIATIGLAMSNQLAALQAKYTGVSAPATLRTHCVEWPDWASMPKLELARGIRMDANYYHYPSAWIGAKPGFMTGGGFPMRFADADGTAIDVYQQHTSMNDEAGQAYPATADALLDGALGPNGYYGAFGVNIHNDQPLPAGFNEVLNAAVSRGVPVVSYKQMLDWVDGRNASTIRNMAMSGPAFTFTTTVGPKATGLQTMLPTQGPAGTLSALSCGGSPRAYTVQTIKGVPYAFFDATTGSCQATYSGA